MAAATGSPRPPGSLDVVALISGGKDSFFSLLHCLEQGHRVLALANLHPPESSTRLSPVGGTPEAHQHRPPLGSDSVSGSGNNSTTTTTNIDSSSCPEAPPESDLNSFMYQTVGHQTIPLYAQATGLPLFRQPIHGSALDHGISYSPDGHHRQTGHGQGDVDVGDDGDGGDDGDDETESLVPLLRAVMKACPSVNAVSTGAILSTYQRTRVESVATRLGLVPLGYLWQYPDLPRSLSSSPVTAGRSAVDDAQLLRDMAHTGLEARIIKVASAGLDEGFLWENVASDTGVARIQRGLRKFGGGGKGAVLGEGGEFETLVVDGPPELFKGRIVVREDDRQVVREGGGSEWLLIRRAEVEMKSDSVGDAMRPDQRSVPIPALLDDKFEAVLEVCGRQPPTPLKLSDDDVLTDQSLGLPAGRYPARENSAIRMSLTNNTGDVQQQTEGIVRDIRSFLAERSLEAVDILNSIVVLKHMSDFPAINKLYGSLFTEANPPSRVTISCGSQLPEGCQIAVHLTVQSSARRGNRKGLHVQSRSYWAPANIGPYSQAISYPLTPRGSTSDQDGVRPSSSGQQSALTAVSIAGQIPLVPATMEFPPPSRMETVVPDATQITLALQHLWRVGIAMDVAWWTSAVAYFPVSSSSLSSTTTTAADGTTTSRSAMVKNSIAAAAAWREAHIWSPARARTTDNDNNGGSDTGPDLWDRKYNAQYQSFSAGGGGDDSADKAPALPRWNVVHGFANDDEDDEDDDDEDTYSANADGHDQDEREQARETKREAQRSQKGKHVPYVFAAEVEQLPRSAGVEWHAHIGLSALGDMSAISGDAVVRVSSSQSAVSCGTSTDTDTGTGDAQGAGYVVELHHVAVTTAAGAATDYDGDDSDDEGERNGKAQRGTYLHTTAVLRRRHHGDGISGGGGGGGKMAFADARRHVGQIYSAAVNGLLATTNTTTNTTTREAEGQHGDDVRDDTVAAGPDPYLTYTDAAAVLDPLGSTGAAAAAAAVIPCHSLHDGQGRRLVAVALFETFLVAA